MTFFHKVKLSRPRSSLLTVTPRESQGDSLKIFLGKAATKPKTQTTEVIMKIVPNTLNQNHQKNSLTPKKGRSRTYKSAFIIGISAALLGSAYCSSDIENRGDPSSHHLSPRETRLQLFDLGKFDKSFELVGNLSSQAQERKLVFGKSYLYDLLKKEVILPNKNKLITYIPYYLENLLSIKSPDVLKLKERYFDDFIKLLNVTYETLSENQQLSALKILDENLSKITLEQYSLSPIFLRFAALQKDTMGSFSIKGNLGEKIKQVYESEYYNRADHYKYHISLEERYKLDKDILEKLSKFETAKGINDIILLHNIRQELN